MRRRCMRAFLPSTSPGKSAAFWCAKLLSPNSLQRSMRSQYESGFDPRHPHWELPFRTSPKLVAGSTSAKGTEGVVRVTMLLDSRKPPLVSTVDDWTQARCRGREREFSPAEDDLTGPKALRWRNRSAHLIQTCSTCPVLTWYRQQRIQLESTVGAPIGVMAGMLNTGGASRRRPSVATAC